MMNDKGWTMRAMGWLGAVMVLILAAGCSETKVAAPYADLKAVYEGVTDAQDQLAAGLNAAADATKVAAVLRTYTAKMRELYPQVLESQAKYPEMANADTPPAELKTTVEALNVSTGAMMDSLAKVQQYLEDPAVTAAMNDMAAAAQAAQTP